MFGCVSDKLISSLFNYRFINNFSMRDEFGHFSRRKTDVFLEVKMAMVA